MLYKTIFTWLTGTRYGGSGGTQEVVSNRLIHVHTHLTHRTVVTPWKKYGCYDIDNTSKNESVIIKVDAIRDI